MTKHFFSFIATAAAVFAIALSCVDTSKLEKDMEELSARLDKLEDAASIANNNAVSLRAIMKGKTIIVGYEALEHGYRLSLSDGSEIDVVFGDKAPGIVPIIGADENGNWTMSYDGEHFEAIKGASNMFVNNGATPQIRISSEGFWQISLDGGTTWDFIYNASGMKLSATDGNYMTGNTSVFSGVDFDAAAGKVTFTLKDGRKVAVRLVDSFYLTVKGYTDGAKVYLNDELEYEVEMGDIASSMIIAPKSWTVQLTDALLHVETPSSGTSAKEIVNIMIFSPEGYMKNVKLQFDFVAEAPEMSGCQQWIDFAAGRESNVLNDYSYAGYDHGETAPLEASMLGYKVYDVTDYGAVPNDGKSDREAFKAAYQAAIGGPAAVQTPEANAIIYFPEGEYILHSKDDDTYDDASRKTVSNILYVRAGNIVIRGAGRDLTTITMADPMLPNDPAVLYSSPEMLQLKHFSGLSELTKVTSDAPKGTFSVEVASTTGINKGDYVCLYLLNNDPALIAEELAPYTVEAGMSDLKDSGVKVYDYHQVAKIEGNKITFAEPILRKVEAKYGWSIQKYPHYNNVGVEDLTFKGKASGNFVHHRSWEDDGAYKPLALTRLTNAWIRRCRFVSVSEACSVSSCANVSVYDIEFTGDRGHAAIRSAGSSRVFIGATKDVTSGFRTGTTTWMENTGQYHAVGVSKPSMGAVLWRNEWGNDSCFESHATQPRATLVDCCKGGWMQSRQGGDAAQVPNHLGDLTVWNMESTTPYTGTWKWYDVKGKYWKFVMPVIVGFHGQPCVFDPSQVTVDASHGTEVEPQSLYEAQLKKRLGYVPAWLNSLK